MRKVWCTAMTLALLAAVAAGRWEDSAAALLAAGERALRLGAVLTGGMMVWGGWLAALEGTPALEAVSRGMRRVLRPLVRRELSEESWAAMGMNLSANLLGLGNAATPLGIRAARLLAQQGEAGLQGLTVLLVMNNSGLALIPTTVMTLRQQAGSAAPGAIWMPTLAATAVSTLTAAVLLLLSERRQRRG